MSQVTQRQTHIEVISVGIVLFVVGTATAHLYLASQPDEKLRFWFLLNGIGYLVLLGAFFLPMLKAYQGVVRWLLFGYTFLTIMLWFMLGSPSQGSLDPFDVTVKYIEVLLCLTLIFHWRRSIGQPV